MSLIKCPECKNDVSTQADVCPHCGFPIAKYIDKKIDKLLQEQTNII